MLKSMSMHKKDNKGKVKSNFVTSCSIFKGLISIGSKFIVKGYVDSNFVGDLDKRKSTTSYVFTFTRGVVSWISKFQTIMALSTTKVEYIVATWTCKEAIWIKRLLKELRLKQEKIFLFYDIQSTLTKPLCYVESNLLFLD